MHAGTIKVGVFGNNGTLRIGGGSISADTLLRLYAPGSNGVIDFVGNVQTPAADAFAQPDPRDTVVIKEDKSLSVRERDNAGRIVSDKPVSRADFPAIFKDPKVPVLVAGDKNVRYEAVLQVMDDLRAQGVERVGLQVKPKQQ